MNIKADKDIALIIGLSAPDFSKRKKSGTLLPLIINYGISKKVNLHWLLTGEGEITRKPEYKNGVCVAEDVSIYKVGVSDDDPEITGLLSMTREILKSSTDYSASLAANVRSFYHAIKTEKRLNKMESRLESFEKCLKKKQECPGGKIAVNEK